MNERIRELAEEAGLKVESWMTNPPKPFQILGSMEEFEKFAELIVQDINNTILHTARWHQEVEKDATTVTALCDLVKDIREEYGVD